MIASGLKDSTIFLHDLRSGGTATRLQHSHSVSKIRTVDPYRLVVAGINSVGWILPSGSRIANNSSNSSKCTTFASVPMASSATQIPFADTTPLQNHTSPSPITRLVLSRTSTSVQSWVFLQVVSTHQCRYSIVVGV